MATYIRAENRSERENASLASDWSQSSALKRADVDEVRCRPPLSPAHFAGKYVLATGSAQVLSIACRMQCYHLLACAIETYSMRLAQIKREA